MNMEAGTIIPGESEQVDYEAEARKMGWTPKEDFKGDPNHHLDAETFYTRSIEFMPIAKATIRKLSNKIDAMERDQKKALDYYSKTEQRAYEKALADIKAEQEAAVESGDVAAFRAADKKADELRKEMSAPQQDEPISEDQRAEEFADWGKENRWYATDPIMQAYADSQAAILARAKNGFLDRADLDAVTEKVKAKFADEFTENGEEGTPKPKRSMVDGGGQRPAPKGGKTYADLPADARAACDRMVKSGWVKSKEQYAKDYFA